MPHELYALPLGAEKEVYTLAMFQVASRKRQGQPHTAGGLPFLSSLTLRALTQHVFWSRNKNSH